jgi:lysyl-tRNA synthetase class I
MKEVISPELEEKLQKNPFPSHVSCPKCNQPVEFDYMAIEENKATLRYKCSCGMVIDMIQEV